MSEFEDIWDQLNGLPLYGQTEINGHAVYCVAPYRFCIDGRETRLSQAAAADVISTRVYREEEDLCSPDTATFTPA